MREPEEPVGTPRDGVRRARLRERAHAAGEAWAQRVRGELRREERVAAGGWPGTLTEARVHARACFDAIAGRRTASFAEIEWLARVTYGRAREEWLAFAEPATDVAGT